MNEGIHVEELEQVFPVVAALGVIVGGMRQTEIRFTPVRFRSQVRGRQPAITAGGDVRWKHNDGAVQAHLHLQVALGTAVVGAGTWGGSSEPVGDRGAVSGL